MQSSGDLVATMFPTRPPSAFCHAVAVNGVAACAHVCKCGVPVSPTSELNVTYLSVPLATAVRQFS